MILEQTNSVTTISRLGSRRYCDERERESNPVPLARQAKTLTITPPLLLHVTAALKDNNTNKWDDKGVHYGE